MNPDFLIDLAKLLKKHGYEPFEEVGNTLKNKERVNALAKACTEIANSARAVGIVAKKKSIPTLIKEISFRNKELGKCAKEIAGRLNAGKVEDAEKILTILGIQGKYKKQEAIVLIIERLAKSNGSDVKQITAALPQYESFLDKWTSIIVRTDK